MTYYVTMEDTFLSGWGESRDKINKLIFICDTKEEQEIVFNNANNRTDMKNIKKLKNKPNYPSMYYYVQVKTKDNYPNWYKQGYFKRLTNRLGLNP